MSNMKIVAYSDGTFTTKVSKGDYEVMLNPEKLQWNRSIQYNEETSIDSSAPASKYSKTLSEKLSFDLVIDCTGVVDSKRVNLPNEVSKLSKVIYDYNGDIHRPNYVIINWGSGLAFKCVLTSFNLSYTFFKPDGTPLRAKVSLEFSSSIDAATLAKKDDKKSPDMSHLVSLVEGDNLPQISNQIYLSPNYYLQIAQFNGLNKFRRLHPGAVLTVPPLKAGNTTNA
ncbi:peptidoglycan-binding protein [Rheinheimera sp. 1928-s]|uniref:CIS tube protein n=1 Tax=Rheinheimera sp. 1928-s TaxID=3033803 RepID=UPI0026334B8E|nr:peptidoglycan-binding protein [Rheinheimera sp. 1928-s]MDF3126588.1 peptidoglycan-binding protein [Rheinheimera sp. 1928-s]